MPAQEPKPSSITRFLPVLEKIFLLALAIGIVLAIVNSHYLLLSISLIGLAGTFFLFAFRPPVSSPDDENAQKGFSELLAQMIIPKVLWISSAVVAIGIALYFLTPENKGYREMLLIGMMTLAGGLVLLTVFLISGAKNLKTVTPVVLRALPALLAAIYFFMK